MPSALGLLISYGGGLRSLSDAGQASRFVNGYLKVYAQRFERIYIFSYLDERLEEYTSDPMVLDRVVLVPNRTRLPRGIYAWLLPILQASRFRECSVLRVFQLTAAPPAMVARLLYGIPYLATYGYKYQAMARVEGQSRKAWLLGLLEPAALRLAAGIIITTEQLRQYLSSRTEPRKLKLVPNGVDTEVFAPDGMLESNKPCKEILFVGRLEHQKNLFRLIDAVASLSGEMELRVTLVGSGSLRRQLEDHARQQRVPVEFAGTIDHSELPRYLSRASLFVLPSLLEGHPKALLEAMSCGVPCVTSSCEGNTAVVTPEVDALQFDPEDVAGLAHKIRRVLSDKELARRLGKSAREKVVANYDLRRLVTRECELLQSLASNGKVPA